jgi:hypothetical protein
VPRAPLQTLESTADISEARLDNVIVKGRFIRADARNATEPIQVRDLKVAGATSFPYGPSVPCTAPFPTFAPGFLQTAQARGFGGLETPASSTYAVSISTDYSSSPASSSFYSQASTEWAWDGLSTCSWNTSWSPCQEHPSAPTRRHHRLDGPNPSRPTIDRPEEVSSAVPDAGPDVTPQLKWQPPLVVNGSNTWRPPLKPHTNTGWLSPASNG